MKPFLWGFCVCFLGAALDMDYHLTLHSVLLTLEVCPLWAGCSWHNFVYSLADRIFLIGGVQQRNLATGVQAKTVPTSATLCNCEMAVLRVYHRFYATCSIQLVPRCFHSYIIRVVPTLGYYLVVSRAICASVFLRSAPLQQSGRDVLPSFLAARLSRQCTWLLKQAIIAERLTTACKQNYGSWLISNADKRPTQKTNVSRDCCTSTAMCY